MLAQVVLTLGWDGTRLGCILSSIAFAGWWPKTIFIVMYGMVDKVDKVDKSVPSRDMVWIQLLLLTKPQV